MFQSVRVSHSFLFFLLLPNLSLSFLSGLSICQVGWKEAGKKKRKRKRVIRNDDVKKTEKGGRKAGMEMRGMMALERGD